MKKLAYALALLTLSATFPAQASDHVGTVNAIGGDTGNPFVFRLNGTRTSRPACATDDNYVIPTGVPENARGLLSLILTALGAGKTVNLHGTGVCSTLWPNREEVAWLWIS